MVNNYKRPQPINLKNHPEFNEKWLQNLIADDPSILGLGDLVFRDMERKQPRAGRLDLLLQDPDTKRRYEVELQLGATDEAHIIRTIEYYDIEKKRYPQYEHCAVLIAEDITSRFLNVISLFNGTLPLIAIQMQAVSVDEYMTIVFAKVIDEFSRGFVDDDEDAEATPADRDYWEKRASKDTVSLADQTLAMLRDLDATLNLKYNKFYIGLEKNGVAYNFVQFRPNRTHLVLELHLPKSESLDIKIEEAGLDSLEYDNRFGRYRLRMKKDDVDSKTDILKDLTRLAYERRAGI
ncbi:MAG: hypothetical protein OXP66_03395 [Candidatus Tectomicrobia bacterium]|nr:hypothetical protein [Candidatus Tectomicrobia bacterium]